VPQIESNTFRAVCRSVRAHLVRVSSHALEEAEADRLRIDEIADRSAVHALWGFDEASHQAILITVYRPDPGRWSQDFRKRRSRDVGEAE
jgi:hypothetical protein